MVEIEIDPVPGDPGQAVQAVADQLGLDIAIDGTLKSFPGCRHWHLRKPGTTGTLEVTSWPERKRLWVTYHANRVGDGWVEILAPEFARLLQEYA